MRSGHMCEVARVGMNGAHDVHVWSYVCTCVCVC